MTQTPKTYGPPWTVLNLLEWSRDFFGGRGIDTARLDAELLLAHVLGVTRVRLYMEFDRPLTPPELDAYRALVKRRAAHEPVAYIVGSRGFWTLDLKTDSRALIPRPDTEVLVEEVVKRLPREPATFVDIGTGTGAIALAVASERPDLRVLATDASVDALALARENAASLQLEVEFLEGDLLDAIPPDITLNYIASNPPYVAESAREAMQIDVRDFEPAAALFAGADGFDVLARLIPTAFERLAPDGWLSVEIGFDQGPRTVATFEATGFIDVALRKDYGQNDRVVSGRKG